MLQISWETFPILQKSPVLLRALDVQDAEVLLLLRSNPEVMQYLDRPPLTHVDEAIALLAKYQAAYDAGTGINWGIALEDAPQTLIGIIAIWRIDAENHRGELGYMLLPQYWGKGLGSSSLQLVLQYGFGTLGLHSIEANVNTANTASQNMLLKAGFRQEAHFRENFYFDGKFLDSLIFCLLASDMPKQQEAVPAG